MSNLINKKVILKSRPKGMPITSNFELVEEQVLDIMSKIFDHEIKLIIKY